MVVSDTGVGLEVRPRLDSDFDELTRIAAQVQVLDGYPGRRPRDLRSFLSSPDTLGAWTAELKGAVAGHVALHRDSLPVVMDRAGAALGCDTQELAVVARLLVDPAVRRRGIARKLLAVAADSAVSQGFQPILDVVTHYDAANALYRSCGWRNLGEVEMTFSDGTSLRSFVYASPRS